MLTVRVLDKTGKEREPRGVIGPIVFVDIYGAINEETAALAQDRIKMTLLRKQPIIIVNVDSPGGMVYSARTIISALDSAPVPVAMIVQGQAMSAAAVILACGTPGLRYAGPEATIMVHSVSGGAAGKIGDMQTSVQEAARLDVAIFNTLAERTGPESSSFIRENNHFFNEKVAERGNTDLFLPPERAKEYGLVDHVRVPSVVVTQREPADGEPDQPVTLTFDEINADTLRGKYTAVKKRQLARWLDIERIAARNERSRAEVIKYAQEVDGADIGVLRHYINFMPKPRAPHADACLPAFVRLPH
jgi:ATP-dependent Clp endopeptidase proteolytic subunit ClpP